MADSNSPDTAAQQSHSVLIPSLRLALDEGGQRLAKGSPLEAFCGDSEPSLAADVGWPEGWDQAEALDCLLGEPLAAITALDDDQKTLHFLFQWTVPDTFCLYSHDGESGHLTAPLSSGFIAAFLAEDFAPLRAPPASGVALTFSKNGFLAFAGITDYCRYIGAVGLLERAPLQVHQFTLKQLMEQVSLTKENADYRWLLGCWPEFFPDEKAIGSAALEAGCDSLADHGLIAKHGEGANAQYLLSAHLAAVIQDLLSYNVIRVFAGKGGVHSSYIGGSHLWKLRFSHNDVELRSIDGLELITGFREALVAADSPSHAEPSGSSNAVASSAKPSFCDKCGAEFRGIQKFCSECGHPNHRV